MGVGLSRPNGQSLALILLVGLCSSNSDRLYPAKRRISRQCELAMSQGVVQRSAYITYCFITIQHLYLRELWRVLKVGVHLL